MANNNANINKAKSIFEAVFQELNLQWVGPEYDSDRMSYKAAIRSGSRKGQLEYISIENLEDSNVSAEEIKQQLLQRLS